MVLYGGFEAFLGRQSCKILGGQTLTLSLRRRHQLHWHQRDYLDVHHSLLCFEKSFKSCLANYDIHWSHYGTSKSTHIISQK